MLSLSHSNCVVSLFAMLLVLSLSPSVFAQGAPPAAGGTVKVTNTVANGTYTFSGSYTTNAGWAPTTLSLYLSHDAAAENSVLVVDGPALAGALGRSPLRRLRVLSPAGYSIAL